MVAAKRPRQLREKSESIAQESASDLEVAIF